MADDHASNWTTMVPEFSYDLLARVLPGAVGLAAVIAGYGCFRAWLLHQHGSFPWSGREVPTVTLSLVFLLAAWVVGFLVTPVGDILWRGDHREKALAKITREYGTILREAEKKSILVHRKGSDVWDRYEREDETNAEGGISGLVYQQLHEHLKSRNAEWRGILIKNQAELTFYSNTAAAMFLYLCMFGLVIPAALVARQVPFAILLTRAGLGFLLTALVPALLTLALAVRGARTKHDRLWIRHMALLTVDLRPTDSLNGPAAGADLQDLTAD